jgi:hypothetical protein
MVGANIQEMMVLLTGLVIEKAGKIQTENPAVTTMIHL